MNIIKTIIFVMKSLSLHQISYNIFPALRRSYFIKIWNSFSDYQVRNLNLANNMEIFDYPKLFSGNKFYDNLWTFNGTTFSIESEFIYGEINKWDYTPRVVFQHYEWLLVQESPTQKFLSYSNEHHDATFYWHPSTATQRFFVILYLFLKFSDKPLKLELAKHIKYIMSHIEVHLNGNHFLDNLLAFLAYAALSNDKSFFAMIELQIKEHFTKKWLFFPEKTPCYCALLFGRLQLIKAIPFELKEFDELCESIGRMLLKNPKVHLNDSYLPLRNWIHIYTEKSSMVDNYYVTYTHEKYTYTLIGDGFAQRGYQAHSHNCSGSLFVTAQSSQQIIGGFGTRTYAAGPERDYCRSEKSYCKPINDVCTRKNTRSFFGSFRNLGYDANQYKLSHDNQGISMTINNSDYTVSVKGNIIDFNARDIFSIVFWSDLPRQEFLLGIEIKGFEIISVEATHRYDGIYNKKNAYKYKLSSLGNEASLVILKVF